MSHRTNTDGVYHLFADADGALGDAAGALLRADARQRRPPLAHDHLPQRQGGRAAAVLLLREHRRRRHLRRVAVLTHPTAAPPAGTLKELLVTHHMVTVGHNFVPCDHNLSLNCNQYFQLIVVNRILRIILKRPE